LDHRIFATRFWVREFEPDYVLQASRRHWANFEAALTSPVQSLSAHAETNNTSLKRMKEVQLIVIVIVTATAEMNVFDLQLRNADVR
jgi:hypothetical protein